METGERKTFKSGPDREELPQVRPKNVVTQCDKCPKKSPENAKLVELSGKNAAALKHFVETRAAGMSEPERGDAIVRRNFATLDAIFRQHEQHQQARVTALEILRAMPK